MKPETRAHIDRASILLRRARASLTAMAQEPLMAEDAARNAAWVVVSRREAYWKPQLVARLARGQVVFERSRQGVWLSRIYKFGP